LYYISAASTISHQASFKNPGFSGSIEALEKESTLINPDFKEYIDAGLLRRMSKILRIAVTCAKDCLDQAGIDQPDAIVVGTGLGCLQDTEKFLNNFLTIEGLLPPTAFIQSTHNTIAGQISLSLGNHGYNMTHTQNSLSFEHALLDALLSLAEDDKNVLVGAADEFIPILDEIVANLVADQNFLLTSGASFFIVSQEQNERSLVRIVDVKTIGLVEDAGTELLSFLQTNSIEVRDIDLVLFAGSGVSDFSLTKLKSVFNQIENTSFVNYQQFSGIYPTNSAFALHLAVDIMKLNKKYKNVLICNNLINSNLGLILIQSIEA
jgi:hypothetical protein